MKILKNLIKNFLYFFGWKLIKVNHVNPKSFVNQKPKIENLKCLLNSNGILHLGAHRGQEAPIYNWLNKQVLWIEANPEIFKDLDNYVKLFYKQKALNFLLGDKKKENLDFFLSNKDTSCSSIFDLSKDVKQGKLWSEHNVKMVKKIKLNMTTLDDILKNNEIDIKNYNHWEIDLQGAELQFLKGAKNALKSCKSINIEISKKNFYEQGSTIWPELLEFLRNEGFKNKEIPTKDHCDILFEKN